MYRENYLLLSSTIVLLSSTTGRPPKRGRISWFGTIHIFYLTLCTNPFQGTACIWSNKKTANVFNFYKRESTLWFDNSNYFLCVFSILVVIFDCWLSTNYKSFIFFCFSILYGKMLKKANLHFPSLTCAAVERPNRRQATKSRV